MLNIHKYLGSRIIARIFPNNVLNDLIYRFFISFPYFYYIRAAKAFGCPSVQLHATGSAMGVSMEDFNNAKEKLSGLKKDPGNEAKLKIYALFKQVSPATL